MIKKTPGKHLLNIEKHFAHDNPTLLQATKVFHDLDQLKFELGLIDNEETSASQYSWWPVISVLGGQSSASSKFIDEYLDTDSSLLGIQSVNHKFTVLQHNNQAVPVTLPGTALDVDHRLPFYRISRKIERLAPGEGENINAFLELKTINNTRLKDKLFIEAPALGGDDTLNPVTQLLIEHSVDISDLVLIFCDIFSAESPQITELTKKIASQQDSNKFVYIIDAGGSSTEIIRAWQQKLAETGIKTGQFIALSSQLSLSDAHNRQAMAIIDQRLNSISHYRSYRILHSLEKNIRDIKDVIVPEVSEALSIWKDRTNFSSLLILGFIATLMVFAEIEMGFFALLFDPIVGPLFLLALIAVMVPLHLFISKLQAKLIISRLDERQQELLLREHLSQMFEKNLTFSRMLWPSPTPAGWNKQTKTRLTKLIEKTKELFLSMNDGFNVYDEAENYNEPAANPENLS
ncbi:MAG: hypothetical protein CVV13_00860 [Gammaproteobacteria bacterium HGW-Gammaproteobacteria-3]|nr:MAG: hypothetical protein CVV13_00860 [Gammaproteobacteria bacterium HGW-Gammaproteobacteria-3]